MSLLKKAIFVGHLIASVIRRKFGGWSVAISSPIMGLHPKGTVGFGKNALRQAQDNNLAMTGFL